MPRRNSGFTLIELMIVVTILAIVASIAIPSLMSARSNATEKTAIALMRSIVTAQNLARTNGMVDMNNNGQGEHASFAELAGTAPLRGSARYLRPAYLSAALGSPDVDGHVLMHTFYFALYLPDNGGVGLSATPANMASVDAGQAENYWSCVAWRRDNTTGTAVAFFTNQLGDILKTRTAPYSGKTNVPPPGCGLLGVADPTHINGTRIAANTVGIDGSFWHLVP